MLTLDEEPRNVHEDKKGACYSFRSKERKSEFESIVLRKLFEEVQLTGQCNLIKGAFRQYEELNQRLANLVFRIAQRLLMKPISFIFY